MKVTSSAFSGLASSIATLLVLVFASDYHYLPTKQFVSLVTTHRFQVYGDWRWLLPPLSGSTVPVYPLEFENRLLKPNYFYVPDPWEIEPKVGKCPFHHQA